MFSTYLAPTEHPITSIAIKRALLTFDKVYLPDPADREFFPPQSMMVAMGMPPIFGFNTGPVRPLPKHDGYENEFDRALDEVSYARRSGLIEVISTYDLSTSKKGTIGAVLTGDYPINPRFLLLAYRNIARDNSALLSAISLDEPLLAAPDEVLEELGKEKGSADGGINDDPALPPIDGGLIRGHLRESISTIARARIASVMKAIGYCTAKELVPTFSSLSYVSIAGHITERANSIIDNVGQFDPHWRMRNRVMTLAHDEYINESVLGQLSIDDVLSLRTRAWGNQGESRDHLLQSAALLAKECENAADFDKAAKEQIAAYRATIDQVCSERSALQFSVHCELVKLVGGVGTAALSGSMFSTLSQLQTGVGAATILLAGCLYAVDKIKEYKPVRDQLAAAEQEFADRACFGLHNFYRRLEP